MLGGPYCCEGLGCLHDAEGVGLCILGKAFSNTELKSFHIDLILNILKLFLEYFRPNYDSSYYYNDTR